MPCRLLRHLALAACLVGVLTVAVSAPARAQVVDDDGDGVADDVDDCIDTPPGDLVDATGCSVCPCETQADGSDWTSHVQYVGCLAAATHSLVRAHAMAPKARRALLKAARGSSCGNPNLTRCCLFAHLDPETETAVGKCRVMTPAKCDDAAEKLDYAEDEGPGSCLPNPCVF
ncbi:MAG TPA: hypothetical protein VFD84_00170 [Candidatus Binatia bacterium]|jgi:hypothetical protein|nr:hypothetical protein [Candidatus Binatia bacterium]